MVTISACIAVAVVSLIVVLVIFAMRQDPPQVDESDPPGSLPSDEWIRTQYQSTTSLYIEVDREIWQISTIFVSASLLLMGWVVTNFDKLDSTLVLVLGCASITLVGTATLFKHRLREFNIVHLGFLRRLERAMATSQVDAEFWGLHYVRRQKMKSKGNFSKIIRSVHGVMDIYLFLFIALWLAIWLLALVRH